MSLGRTYYFTSNNTARITTSATHAGDVNVSFAATASARYAVLWSGKVNIVSATVDGIFRLVDHNTGNILQSFNIEPQTADDQLAIAGAYGWTANSSPGTQNFGLQYAVETGGTTMYIDDQRLTVLELKANDVFSTNTSTYSSVGIETDGDNVYDTLETINVGAGRYIIVASASINSQSGSLSGSRVLVWDDTNNQPYGYQNGFYTTDGATYEPYFYVGIFVTTGNTNFDLRAECEYNETMNIRQRTLLALEQTGFREVFSNHRENYITTTSATDVEGLSLTATPSVGGNALVIAAWTTSQRNNPDGVRSNLRKGSTDYFEADAWFSPRQDNQGVISQGDARAMNGYVGVENLSSAATTWTIDFNTDVALQTAEISRRNISILDLQNHPKQVLGTKSGGTWSNAQPFIKVNNEWKPAYASVKIAGNWTPLQNVYVVAAGVDANSNNYTSVFPNAPAPSPAPSPVVSPGPEGGP